MSPRVRSPKEDDSKEEAKAARAAATKRVAKIMGAGKMTKQNYSQAYAAACTLKNEISGDQPNPSYVFFNTPSMIKPLNDAIDEVCRTLQKTPLFKSFVSSDLYELRSSMTNAKTKVMTTAEFDDLLDQFSSQINPLVEHMQSETRILLAQIQARESERQRQKVEKAAEKEKEDRPKKRQKKAA